MNYKNDQNDGVVQVVIFKLGNDIFGIDVKQSREVLNLTEITRVPHTLPCMKGLIDLRGTIVPVIDMRIKLTFEEKAYDESTAILIVNIHGKLVGLIVDIVEDVWSIQAGEIQNTAHFTEDINHDAVSGVVKKDDKLLQLLDLDKLISSEEMEGLNAPVK